MQQLLGLIGVLLLTASYSTAQIGDIHIPEEKLIHVNNKIDSLPYLLASGQAITFSKDCLLPGHEQYLLSATGFSLSMYALRLSEASRTAYVRMYALSDLAAALDRKNDYKTSTRYWQEALGLAMHHQFSYDELYCYRPALNNNYFLAGDYTGAMKVSTEGLERAEKIKDENRIAHFNNVIGFIHMKQGNFTEASQYYTRYLQQAREMENKGLEAHALSNLGDLATTQHNYTEAIRFLKQSLRVYHLYPGIGTAERQAYLSDRLAETFKWMKDPGTALKYSLAALALTYNVSCNQYDIARYYINAGDIYNRLQHPDSALIYLREGLAIAQRIKYREELKNAYEQMAASFASTRKFDSAYYYQRLFAALKDSLASENSERKALQREAALQIMQQKRLQQVELSRQHLWRNIIIGIALFVILALILLYNHYRIQQKIGYQQQLNRQQNEMFNLAVSVQEQERKRIAEDIHDSLGSVLSAAKLKLSSLEEDALWPTEAQREKYQATLVLLDEAVAELRNISHNIMPATLSKLGLPAAIKNLAGKISSSTGLQVHFEAHGLQNRIDESTEISIYRVILELLNNIVKHANARKATIQVIRYPDYINVTVEDDGAGFDYKRIAEQGKGIGLGNILSRVEYLKGTINIDSWPGRGTAVIIDIPYGK